MRENITDKSGPEGNESLAYWTRATRERWENTPEFLVDPEKLRHIAIICDGNRRSAKAKGLVPQHGHTLGAEVIKGIMRASQKWGIHTSTFWVWSTENWRRREDQVGHIMSLAAENLSREDVVDELTRNEVRFVHLGRKDRLPKAVGRKIQELEELTSNFNRFHLNLAMDYGGLEEVVEAVARITDDVSSGKININQIHKNPELILGYLYTKDQPHPDLIIRTGMQEGEFPRTSGFLPLQSAYSLWAYTSTDFPDLTPDEFKENIQSYLGTNRRFGG